MSNGILVAAFLGLLGTGKAADSLAVFRPGDTARASTVNANFKLLWERMNALAAENRALAADNRVLGRRVDSLRLARPPISDGDSLDARLPVGTIVASLLPPALFAGSFRTKTWQLADGSLTDAPEYAAAFGTNLLPDLRGVFLRGLNLARSDSLADPDGSRLPGKGQGDATRLPKTGFTIGSAGSHNHSMNFETSATRAPQASGQPTVINTVAYPALQGAAHPTTAAAGAHTHSLSGGDAETRPKNVAVYYYIKVR